MVLSFDDHLEQESNSRKENPNDPLALHWNCIGGSAEVTSDICSQTTSPFRISNISLARVSGSHICFKTCRPVYVLSFFRIHSNCALNKYHLQLETSEKNISTSHCSLLILVCSWLLLRWFSLIQTVIPLPHVLRPSGNHSSVSSTFQRKSLDLEERRTAAGEQISCL